MPRDIERIPFRSCTEDAGRRAYFFIHPWLSYQASAFW